MSRLRTRTPRRRGASALVAAGLLVVASACSAGGNGTEGVATGPGSVDVAFLNEAAAATGEVQTLKVAVTATVEGLGTGGDLTTSSTGEIDRAGRRAHLTVDATGAVSAVDGAVDGGLELPDGAGELELVLDGDTAYLRSPLYASLVGSDATWVSISRAALGEAAGPGAGTGGTSAVPGDPTDLLSLLEGVGEPLTELGREEVRGVDTRHVSTVIDLESTLDQLPADRYEGLVDELRTYGAEAASYVRVPVEAWVDDDGHVRRFRLTLDFSPAADDDPELGAVSAVVTAELYDFDVPVDIAVPDPADVSELDLGDLLGGD